MRKINLKKVLFGLSISLVLAMAIGSFALSEAQTPTTPTTQRASEPRSVAATTEYGDFNVTESSGGSVSFNDSTGVLTINGGTHTISMKSGKTSTANRIEVANAETTITLNGVNINTSGGPALKIADNATFNVTIKLSGENTLKGKEGDAYQYDPGAPGIEKSDNGSGTPGKLTIEGEGSLTATGGDNAAGIGGGYRGNGSNITISGGVVTATGGNGGAGIGGGYYRNGSNITISGGEVTAIGGTGGNGAGIGGGFYGSGSNITISGGVVTAIGGGNGAGIGGGYYGSGSNITISGGVVTATGGNDGAGIGGGWNENGSNITISGGEVHATGGSGGAGIGGGSSGGSVSGNSLNGDAVVLATSGSAYKEALEGFSYTQGIAFEKKGADGTWSGIMYGSSVGITANAEFPANLTIGGSSESQSLTVNTGVTLTIPTGVTLTNGKQGSITETGTIDCKGKIETVVVYDVQGGSAVTDGTFTYRDNNETKKYGTLSTVTKTGYTFDGWYTEAGGQGTNVTEDSDVMLNQHTLYAKWLANDYNVTIETLTGGTITSDKSTAQYSQTVTLTVTPDTGYSFVDGSLSVTAGSGSVPTTKGEGDTYTFTMPAEDVTVSAEFEENSYEVTIDKQDGSEPEKQTVLYGETVTKPADPTRDGYSFVNWYTNAEGTGNPYDFSAPVESSFTIYAKWVQQCTVTFSVPTGTAPDAQTVDIGSKATDPGVQWQGNTVEWYKDQDFTNKWDFDDDTVTANTTLYAKFGCTVSFDSQGGSSVDPIDTTYGKTISKPADPTRDGYSLVDWYKEAACKNAWDFDNDTVEGNTTLYAKWLGDEHDAIIPTYEHGKITIDPEKPRTGDTVILTATPDEGYQVKGLPSVKLLRQNEKLLAAKSGNDIGDIEVTPIGNNQYSFVMPNGNVEISAEFEAIPDPGPGPDPTPTPPTPTPTPPGPEPTPTPTPTPDPSVDPDGGSGGGASSKTGDPFACGMALALLGIATTGVILTRKLR